MVGIDLGLPSGLLWASQNVGAERRIDAGLYFSWGNVDGHTESDGYIFTQQAYTESPGYQLGNHIDLAHDAARVNLGGSWRMPSRAEIDELFANCVSEMTTVDDVYGCKLTSNINGAELFLPAGGHGQSDGYVNKGSECMIWSDESSDTSRAYSILLRDGFITPVNSFLRRRGANIRAVHDP